MSIQPSSTSPALVLQKNAIKNSMKICLRCNVVKVLTGVAVTGVAAAGIV